MKKVLFVATVVKTHIMTFHTPYLKLFHDMGWETAVAARNDYEEPADCVIPYCDRYYDIPFERFPLKLSNVRAWRMLKDIIDSGEYDIIHCHTPVGAMLTRLAARKARKRGTKVIYTAHGFHFFRGAPRKNWLLYYPVERLLSRWTDVLVTINREDFARAKRFSAQKVCCVPGVGIDLSTFEANAQQRAALRSRIREQLHVPHDAAVVLSVGELSVRKNHHIMIRALAQMPRKDVYYVICGRGPLLQQLRQLADELGVAERVIFTGFCDNVKEFYPAADVFVFPSLQEGLPVALMEAMASGLPVVCTDIRGNSDLIENGISGIVTHATPTAFAQAVCELIDDAHKRERYSASAGRLIKGYALEKAVAQMRTIYDGACGGIGK